MMLFLSILIVMACTANSQPQCLPSQTELFYESAENFTDWIFDAAGTAFRSYQPVIDDIGADWCYDEDCYGILQIDDDSVTTTTNSLSKLGSISTIGYTDITIDYALKHTSTSNYVDSTAFGECGSSYTVDGETFSTLDSHASVAGVAYNEWLNSPMQIITASLGPDASNSAALQIRWEATSLWPINSTNSGNVQFCVIDEIRLCGTATPTTYRSDSSSVSGDSSDSASASKLKRKRKKISRSTSSESSESIYSALSLMNNVDERNENEQNVNVVISVAQKTSINLVIMFVFINVKHHQPPVLADIFILLLFIILFLFCYYFYL